MTSDDERWRDRFHRLPQLPVDDRLLRRIADRAAAADGQQVSRTKRRRRSWWMQVGAVACGVAAAGVVAIGVFHARLAVPLWRPSTTAATRGVQASSVVARSGPYGLKLAPLAVQNLRMGSRPGYAPHSFVFAHLVNTGTTALRLGDVVGVLHFSGGGPGGSAWIALVNGPSQPVAPGAAFNWSFRPLENNGTPVGTPTLTFYDARLVSPTAADVVWRGPADVVLSDIQVLPRYQGPHGRSFAVSAVLTNRSARSVSLANLLALVWFSPRPGTSWTAASAVRFLDPLQTSNPASLAVPPGRSAQIELPPQLGPGANFLAWPAQIALIEEAP